MNNKDVIKRALRSCIYQIGLDIEQIETLSSIKPKTANEMIEKQIRDKSEYQTVLDNLDHIIKK